MKTIYMQDTLNLMVELEMGTELQAIQSQPAEVRETKDGIRYLVIKTE